MRWLRVGTGSPDAVDRPVWCHLSPFWQFRWRLRRLGFDKGDDRATVSGGAHARVSGVECSVDRSELVRILEWLLHLRHARNVACTGTGTVQRLVDGPLALYAKVSTPHRVAAVAQRRRRSTGPRLPESRPMPTRLLRRPNGIAKPPTPFLTSRLAQRAIKPPLVRSSVPSSCLTSPTCCACDATRAERTRSGFIVPLGRQTFPILGL